MKYEGACSIFLSSVRFGKLCRDLADGPKLGAQIMFDDLLRRGYSSFMEQCIAEELNGALALPAARLYLSVLYVGSGTGWNP